MDIPCHLEIQKFDKHAENERIFGKINLSERMPKMRNEFLDHIYNNDGDHKYKPIGFHVFSPSLQFHITHTNPF